jgi:GTPase SAR1 family protein
MPQRKPINRRVATPVAISAHVPKILLVGPALSGKSTFVKSFFDNPLQEFYSGQLQSGKTDLEVYPITHQGKKYSLWDASSNKDFHLSSWGKGSSLIVVFGEDESWVSKMNTLFPQVPIKMFNVESKISNLEV